MRMQSKRFRATVYLTAADDMRPIGLGLGPALSFHMDIDEARDLETALRGAIAQAERGVLREG